MDISLETWGWKRVSGELVANGHNLQVNIEKNDKQPMTSLDGKIYVLEQLHFHWNGEKNKDGSEHAINGRRFDAEVHFVHRWEDHPTLQDAIDNGGGDALLVIGYVMTGRNRMPYGGLKRLLRNAPKYIDDSPKQLRNFDLTRIVDPGTVDYHFMYDGSLTSGEFQEVVQWVVGKKPLTVSYADIKKLESTELEHDAKGNNRDRQPINRRNVWLTMNDAAGSIDSSYRTTDTTTESNSGDDRSS